MASASGQRLSADNPEVHMRKRVTGAAPPDAKQNPRRVTFLALLAVHGDEPCGVHAANRLLAAGFFNAAAAAPGCPWDELRLVVGNPAALARGVRFLDLNLNRAFTDETVALGAAATNGSSSSSAAATTGGSSGSSGVPYEAARAAYLAPLIDGAAALLDIHSTSRPTPPFAFYVPADGGPLGSTGNAVTATATGSTAVNSNNATSSGRIASGKGAAAAAAAPPAEATLALALPVAYTVRDYTGAGLGLAIERSAAAARQAAAGGGSGGAGPAVTPPAQASCVECGDHTSPESVDVAEACLRVFATGGWLRGSEAGGTPAAAPQQQQQPPKHIVAKVGVVVRRGFRWLHGGKDGAAPPAFARVDEGEVVAADDERGDIRCPCPGGALVFMPAGAPREGEDALLWGEDYGR
jgi:hypothetical protein